MKVKFFNIAKIASYQSNHRSHKIGAVIVRKNRVISSAANKLKTHPKSPHKWKSLHAEFVALLGVDKQRLEGASIYVFRQRKNGAIALAKPCPTCEMALRECGIKECFWTKEGGYGKERYW